MWVTWYLEPQEEPVFKWIFGWNTYFSCHDLDVIQVKQPFLKLLVCLELQVDVESHIFGDFNPPHSHYD